MNMNLAVQRAARGRAAARAARQPHARPRVRARQAHDRHRHRHGPRRLAVLLQPGGGRARFGDMDLQCMM